jgi:sterol desaturase/sphingolipid hydroxylase (fatty acid hydroxylase superfamily)
MNEVLQKMCLLTLTALMFFCVPLHALKISQSVIVGHDHHNTSELSNTLIEHFHNMTDAVVSFFAIVFLVALCVGFWLCIQQFLLVNQFCRAPQSFSRRSPPELLRWLRFHLTSPPHHYA